MTTAASRRKQPAEACAVPSPRNVVLAVAVSLDGYIARKNGAVDWLIMDPQIDLASYAKTFDVIMAGRKTLDVPEGAKGGANPWGMMNCYIFSRSKPPGERGGVEYVNQAPSELIRRIREQPGKDIWLMGGGELAREFLKEDLVDRMDLGIMPVLLGDGIPLFPQGFPQRNFALEKFQAYKSGIVRATYSRVVAKPREKN
ncbi:MAG TPA: dihydrofolate reductase family protein [Candidatus Methylomirabilis sp.]|nr:dihydrofolate reductase family protein [Candidatus Methylomirabilis sp.]